MPKETSQQQRFINFRKIAGSVKCMVYTKLWSKDNLICEKMAKGIVAKEYT